MARVVALLMAPVIALIWLAGPVGGVWLAIRGDWWAVGIAIGSVLTSHFVIGIAMLPGIALAAPAAMIGARRPRLLPALTLPTLLYTVTLMTVWCVGVLLFFMGRATDGNWVPLLLLSFSVATGPWFYMASKEAQGGGGDASAAATMFMTLAFLVSMGLVTLDRGRPESHLWVAFGAVMVLYVALTAVLSVAGTRAGR